jgi:hypothetical protein
VLKKLNIYKYFSVINLHNILVRCPYLEYRILSVYW